MAPENKLLDGFLTIDEAAAELRVCAFTLKRWRAQRRGPKHVHIGRRVFYRVADLQAWIDEQVKAAQTKRVR
ncbi:MAG: helix-turn-helix transcriptional regulator [Luteimonas sp.]